jgi:hypothetical protein
MTAARRRAVGGNDDLTRVGLNDPHVNRVLAGMNIPELIPEDS